MSATELFEQAKSLPPDKRIELAELLWESAVDEAHDPDLNPEQLAELERRAEELRKNPELGIPWEDIRADLKKKYGWK
jgi:putative addiction module component (TIGR02574 family)